MKLQAAENRSNAQRTQFSLLYRYCADAAIAFINFNGANVGLYANSVGAFYQYLPARARILHAQGRQQVHGRIRQGTEVACSYGSGLFLRSSFSRNWGGRLLGC